MTSQWNKHSTWRNGRTRFLFVFTTILVMGWYDIIARSPVTNAAITTFPLIPHHVQKIRHQRQLRPLLDNDHKDNPVQSSSMRRRHASRAQTMMSALYQGYGTHYVDLWCGTPPQRQTVVVDTRSDDTVFPCNRCQNCGDYHVDPRFEEQLSSTFHAFTCEEGCHHSTRTTKCAEDDRCEISMAYSDEVSWVAHQVMDNCYLGGPHEQPLLVEKEKVDDILDPSNAKNFAFDLVFGCETVSRGIFKTQLADGILGMGYSNTSFWNQMAEKQGMEKQFSLCFSYALTADRKGTAAGAITLGGVDERLNDSPMVYTPSDPKGKGGQFEILVRRMWLRASSEGMLAQSIHGNGTMEVPLPEESNNTTYAVVDSGATDIYWEKSMKEAFQEAFETMTGFVHTNQARSLTDEEYAALPTILFQIVSNADSNPGMDPYQTPGLAGSLDPDNPHDVILACPPSHYMEYDPERGTYTSRIYMTEYNFATLGAKAMMGHNILFDVQSDRIGWAESECDYTKLLTDNGYDFSITGQLQTFPPGQVIEDSKLYIELGDICDTQGCQLFILVLAVVGVVSSCCFVYKCWHHSKSSIKQNSTGYAKAPTNELELAESTSYRDDTTVEDEATTGGVASTTFMIHEEFQDEPDPTDSISENKTARRGHFI